MSNLSIVNHKLAGDHVVPKTCTKNADKFAPALPDSIIIHFTAGRSAESSADYLCGDVKASAHLVIGRSGEIFQLVAFDTIAWHAGVSQYGGRSNYNQYSIGIELDNAGRLDQVGTEYQSWFGQKYQQNDVVQAIQRNETQPSFWHTYTPEQIETCRQVCELLIKTYQINQILGHEEIAPGRKIDPGPAFPLDNFRNNLLLQNRSDENLLAGTEGMVVNTDLLNIREQAGIDAKKVAQPLRKGTEVVILEETNGWYRVETKIQGWVSKAYIEPKTK